LVGKTFSFTGAGRATVKLVVAASVAPPTLTCACTLTRSPGVNGWAGTKLSPVPVEYARRLPVWLPLRDPTAFTDATLVPAGPRKLICVPGVASGVPGIGETATGLDAAATAAALSVIAIGAEAPGEEPLQALSESAQHAHTSAASARAMYRFRFIYGSRLAAGQTLQGGPPGGRGGAGLAGILSNFLAHAVAQATACRLRYGAPRSSRTSASRTASSSRSRPSVTAPITLRLRSSSSAMVSSTVPAASR